MFNKNSALVILWVKNVQEGRYTKEQVPNLSNLREVVYKILDEQ